MDLSNQARQDLAAKQSALVAALLGKGETPEGFDVDRIRQTAFSLERKRFRAVMRVWPSFRDSFSTEEIDGLFRDYACETPLPAEGGPLADGRAFAAWLHRQQRLPESSRTQMFAVDLRHVLTSQGLRPRGWPCLRFVRLRKPTRFVVAIYLPPFGEYWLQLPLGR